MIITTTLINKDDKASIDSLVKTLEKAGWEVINGQFEMKTIVGENQQ